MTTNLDAGQTALACEFSCMWHDFCTRTYNTESIPPPREVSEQERIMRQAGAGSLWGPACPQVLPPPPPGAPAATSAPRVAAIVDSPSQPIEAPSSTEPTPSPPSRPVRPSRRRLAYRWQEGQVLLLGGRPCSSEAPPTGPQAETAPLLRSRRKAYKIFIPT